MAIYVDFVGLNTLIQEPINTTTNEIGHLTSSNMTSSRNTSIKSIAQENYLVALNLHRNGPYGWPTFKQLRAGSNPVLRRQKQDNTFSHYEYPGPQTTFFKGDVRQVITRRRGPVKHYNEVPVVSKHQPLKLVGSVTVNDSNGLNVLDEVEVFNTFGNQTQYFSNNEINTFFNAHDIIDHGYENFIDLYLDGGLDGDRSPIDQFVLMKYSQFVFPKEKYTYKSYMRQRPNFVSGYWKDARTSRTELNQQNGFGFLVPSQSMWVLDGEQDFQNLTYEISPGQITLSSPENYVFGTTSASATSFIYPSSSNADSTRDAYHFHSASNVAPYRVADRNFAAGFTKSGTKTSILLDKSLMPTTAAVDQIANKLSEIFTADGFSVTKTVNKSLVPAGKRLTGSTVSVPYYNLINSTAQQKWQQNLSKSCLSFWLFNESSSVNNYISGTVYQEINSSGQVIKRVEMLPENNGTLKVSLGTVFTNSAGTDIVFDADDPNALSVTFPQIYGTSNPYYDTNAPSAGSKNNNLEYTTNRHNHFLLQLNLSSGVGANATAQVADFRGDIEAGKDNIAKLFINGASVANGTIADERKFTFAEGSSDDGYVELTNNNSAIKYETAGTSVYMTASSFTSIQPFSSTGFSFSYWIHHGTWSKPSVDGEKFLIFNIKDSAGNSRISHFLEQVAGPPSVRYLTTLFSSPAGNYWNRCAITDGSTTYFNSAESGGQNINGNGPWQHIAYTIRTGSSDDMESKLFINKTLSNSITWPSGSVPTKVQWQGIPSSNSLKVFDKEANSLADGVGDPMTGDLDDVSLDQLTFFNGGLSQTKLQELYNGTNSTDVTRKALSTSDYPSTETSLGLQTYSANLNTRSILKHSTLLPELNAVYNSGSDMSTFSAKGHQIMPLGSQYTPANFHTNVVAAGDANEMDFACWIKPTHNAYRTRGIRRDSSVAGDGLKFNTTNYYTSTGRPAKGLFISFWLKVNQDPTADSSQKVILRTGSGYSGLGDFQIELGKENYNSAAGSAEYLYVRWRRVVTANDAVKWNLNDLLWDSSSKGWKHIAIQWNGRTGAEAAAELWVNNVSKGVQQLGLNNYEHERQNTNNTTYLLNSQYDSEISNLVIITDPKDPTSAAAMRSAIYNSGQHATIDSTFKSNHLTATTNTSNITTAVSGTGYPAYFTAGVFNRSRAFVNRANRSLTLSGISDVDMTTAANRGGITISFWFRAFNGNVNQWMNNGMWRLFSIWGPNNRKMGELYNVNGTFYGFAKSAASGADYARFTYASAPAYICNGQWNHVLWTWDYRTDGNGLAGNAQLYVNGVEFVNSNSITYGVSNGSISNAPTEINKIIFMDSYAGNLSSYDSGISNIRVFNQYMGDGTRTGGSISTSGAYRGRFIGGTAYSVTASGERVDLYQSTMNQVEYMWTNRTSTYIQPPKLYVACSDYAGDTTTTLINRAYRDPMLHTHYALGSETPLRSLAVGVSGSSAAGEHIREAPNSEISGSWPIASKIRNASFTADSVSNFGSTMELLSSEGLYLASGPDWIVDGDTNAARKWGQIIFSHYDDGNSNTGPQKGVTLALTASGGVFKLKSKIDRATTDEVKVSKASLSPNRWYYIYGSYNLASGAPTGSFYINGVEMPFTTETAGAGNYNPPVRTSIDSYRPGVTVGGAYLGEYQPFCGFLQDICFWKNNDTSRADKYRYSIEGIFSGSQYINAGDSNLIVATEVGYNQGGTEAKATRKAGTIEASNSTHWRDNGGASQPQFYNIDAPKYTDFTGSNQPTNVYSFWWKSGNAEGHSTQTEQVFRLVGDEIDTNSDVLDTSNWSQIEANRSNSGVCRLEFTSIPQTSPPTAYFRFYIKNKLSKNEHSSDNYAASYSTGLMSVPWASASATTHYALVHDQQTLQLFINGNSSNPVTLSGYNSDEVPSFNAFVIGDESGQAESGLPGRPLANNSLIDEFAVARYYDKAFGSATRKVLKQGETQIYGGNLALESGYGWTLSNNSSLAVSFWYRADRNAIASQQYHGLFALQDQWGDDIFKGFFKEYMVPPAARIYGSTNNTVNQYDSYYRTFYPEAYTGGISGHIDPLDGEWHHLTFNFFENNYTFPDIYIDGYKTGNGYGLGGFNRRQGSFYPIDKIQILGVAITGENASLGYEGEDVEMHDFVIWNTALNDSQALELYNLGQDAGITTHSQYSSVRDHWLLGEESELNGIASGSYVTKNIELPSQIDSDKKLKFLPENSSDANSSLRITTKANTFSGGASGYSPIISRIYNGGNKYNFNNEEAYDSTANKRSTVVAWWRMGESDGYVDQEVLGSIGSEVSDASLTKHDLTTVYGTKWKVVDTKVSTSDLIAWYEFTGLATGTGYTNTVLPSSVSGAPSLILAGTQWKGATSFDSLKLYTKRFLASETLATTASFLGRIDNAGAQSDQLRPSVLGGFGVPLDQAYRLWVPEIALFGGVQPTTEKSKAKTTLTLGSSHVAANSFKAGDKIYFVEDPHGVGSAQQTKTIIFKSGNSNDTAWTTGSADVALSASSTARTNAELATQISSSLSQITNNPFSGNHTVSVSNNILTLEAKTAGGDGQYIITTTSSRGSAVTITTLAGHSHLAKSLTSAPQFAYRAPNDTDFHRNLPAPTGYVDDGKPYIWLRGHDFGTGSTTFNGGIQRASSISSVQHTLLNIGMQNINDCGFNSGSTISLELRSSPSLDLEYIDVTENNAFNAQGISSFASPGQPLALIGGWTGARARRGPGILQNNYNQFTQGIVTGSDKSLDTQFSASACYFRRHTLTASTSIVAPFSGFLGKLSASQNPSNSRTKLTGSVQESHLYLGSAKWEAGYFAGAYNDQGAFIRKTKAPFFDTYDKFVADARPVLKNYGILPEFRISDHVEEYRTLGPTEQKLDLFNVHGGLSTANTSEKPDFYKIYSTTDFLKHFKVIQEDHSGFVDPFSIKLKCSAVMKFLPYNGFYPAQRTVQIAQQFYESYNANINITGGNFTGSVAENSYAIQYLLNPLFSPGILFNTIKAGVACDYPLITDTGSIGKITGSQDGGAMITQKFDTRVPFEALAEPEKYLANLRLASNEPDPNGDTGIQIEWGGQGNDLYHMMVSNFMAETAEFFLESKSYTTIPSLSQGDANFGQAQAGKTYMMRLKMFRAISGSKSPVTNSAGKSFGIPQDSTGVVGESFTMYSRPSAFGPPQKFNSTATSSTTISFVALPQTGDILSITAQGVSYVINYLHGSGVSMTTFTDNAAAIYTAGATPSIVRDRTADLINSIVPGNVVASIGSGAATELILIGPEVSEGGQATTATSNDTSTITVANTAPAFSFIPTTWNKFKFDGTSGSHDFSYTTGSGYGGVGNQAEKGYNYPFTPPYYHGEAWADITFTPAETKKFTLSEIINSSSVEFYRYFESGSYGVKTGVSDNTTAINDQAMQLASSVNIFSQGVLEQDISTQTATGINSVTTVDVDTDITNKYRWIIQTKFETPMLNFNKYTYGTGSGNYGITLPGVGPMQTPIGMWHQYGHIPQTSADGVFLQVTDTPSEWIQNAMNKTEEQQAQFDSLASLCGFSTDPVRMGEIDGVKKISEAVVAVPFFESGGRRNFFKLKRRDIQSALTPSRKNLVGESIIDMVEKMNKYVFPPSMDFVSNEDIEPFSMYIFEFEHNLSKLDLADIWQNLPPDITTSFKTAEATISHQLLAYELMGSGARFRPGLSTERELIRNDRASSINPEIQWMVFKVKKRGKGSYFEKIFARNESQQLLSEQLAATTTSAILGQQRKVNYNWPYDYFSLIEGIRLSAEVEFAHVDDEASAVQENIVYRPMRKRSSEDIARIRAASNEISSGIGGSASPADFANARSEAELVNRGKINRDRRTNQKVKPSEVETRDGDYDNSKK